jgi:hypothetical protein
VSSEAALPGAPATDVVIDDVVVAALAARDAARACAASSGEALRQAGALARRQLDERPWTVLGIAVAVGVVAGGMPPVARGVIRMGTRYAMAAATRQLAMTVLSAAMNATTGSARPAQTTGPTDPEGAEPTLPPDEPTFVVIAEIQ